MNVSMGNNPQVTIAPRCPSCGSSDTATCRSQGFELEHEGERCRAQKQYRRCRKCGTNFPVVHIKGSLPNKLKPRKMPASGEWSKQKEN